MASEGADSALNAFMMRFESDIDHDRRCVIRNAAPCPNGYRWFEARIDFSIGEWRAVHLASTLVTELSRANFGNYRLIAGREWIDLALLQRGRMREQPLIDIPRGLPQGA